MLRRRGGEVGSKKVEYVGWDRVWLSSGGSLCQAQMFKAGDAPKPVAAAEAPPPPPVKGGGAPSLDEGIKKGIVKVGPTEYNINRGVVDKILENQADLMRQARIVEGQEKIGKTVGMFGVRPDTLLGVMAWRTAIVSNQSTASRSPTPRRLSRPTRAFARRRRLTIVLNRHEGNEMNMNYDVKSGANHGEDDGSMTRQVLYGPSR